MLQELFAPMVKTFQAYITEIRDTFSSLLYRFFPFQMSFGIKLIGKANYLLFHTHRKHIPMRYRQVLCNNIV